MILAGPRDSWPRSGRVQWDLPIPQHRPRERITVQGMTARVTPVLLALALVLLGGCTPPAPSRTSLPPTSAPGSASAAPSSSPTSGSTCGSGSAPRIPGDIDGDGVADPVVQSQPAGPNTLEVHNSAAGTQVITRDDLPFGSARSFFGTPIVADVTGDGCADVLTFATGEIDLIPGSTSGLVPAKATSVAGPRGNDSWGNSMALVSEPRMLAVGVPTSPRSPHDGGAVMLYPIGDGGRFGEPALIHQDTAGIPGDSEAADLFGWELAADGDTLVIGAPGETIGNHRGAGAVTVLRFTGSGLAFNGLRLAQDNPGFDARAEESDGLGGVLSVRGNLVALGVPNESIGGARGTGIVHVVELSTGSLRVERVHNLQQDSPGIPDTNEYLDHFGGSVAFGSNIGCTAMVVVVGAPGERIVKEKSGSVTLAGLGKDCGDQWLAASSPIGAAFVRYLGRRVVTLPGGPDAGAPDIVLVADNNARPTGELETGYVTAVRTLGAGSWKAEPVTPRDGHRAYEHFGQELGLVARP